MLKQNHNIITKAASFVLVLITGLIMSCQSIADAKPQTWPVLQKVGDRSKIEAVPLDKVIAFTLYTVQDGVLKLSAQLYPLKETDEHKLTLETQSNGQWKSIATAKVHPIGWSATFRVEQWDQTKNIKYRVRHTQGSSFQGVIRKDPIDKNMIVAAVFTGNSPGPGGGKISKKDVVDSVKKMNPDVLLFTGDQVYPHTTHTAEWLKFGEIFKEIMRDRPTVCLPDDHDVGQPNLWGGGGGKVKRDVDGGYTRPASYVKMVERQQTSHMPDPYDPTPIKQGIGVYYTSMNIGGIDFAIIEDRKFKSGCIDFDIQGKKLGPRPDHIVSAKYNPKEFDVPGKKLLGDRQLKFLNDWATKWDGVVIKTVVSQTAFSMSSTHHGGGKTFYNADFDANGWPQTGRNKAIEAMRRAYAFHICGDQHLSTVGQYGVDEFRDSGWWFCVPSIANLWPRWWQPNYEPVNKINGGRDYLGDYLDGFGNKMTIFAHTNPYKTGREPAQLHDRMPGFGMVRFNKKTRQITMECWPRQVAVDNDKNQYPGWPRTISQFDQYPRKAVAYLPTLVIKGANDPVVQVIDESNNEVVYTLRIKGNTFQPKVFKSGQYTIKVTKAKGLVKTYDHVQTGNKTNVKILQVTFE